MPWIDSCVSPRDSRALFNRKANVPGKGFSLIASISYFELYHARKDCFIAA